MRTLATIVWIFIFAQTSLGEVVLFDGLLGTAPASQGWTFIADPILGHSVTQSVGPQFTALDTRDPITDRGGYFVRNPLFPTIAHPLMPTIDRAVGFVVEFELRVEDERHTTGPAGDDNGDGLDDRSGYAVIVISSDTLGIELSFWDDRIWAQADDSAGAAQLFTQAEGSAFDTSSGIVRYQLQMFGSSYRLVRDDGIAKILTGAVRDYGSFMGSVDPYEIANFLFFGDNTTRGESLSQLASVGISALPSMCIETDALVAAIVTGQHPAAFDVTGDGLVNQGDLSAWLLEAGEFRLGPERFFLPGDANFDGLVDGSDFGIWNSHKFTATPGWCSGDFNADGFVDGSDFGIWNSHKFTSSDGTVTLPEPALAAWVILVGSIMIVRRNLRDVQDGKGA